MITYSPAAMKSEFICHHVFSIRSHSILLSFHCHYLRNYIIKSCTQFRFFEWDRSLYQWLARLTRHHSTASIFAYSIFSLSLTIIYLIYFLSFFSGNFAPYLVSYMRQKKISPDLRYDEAAWIFAMMTLGQGFSGFLGGILERIVGPRFTTIFGSWIMR